MDLPAVRDDQDGVFTRAQLLASGVTRAQLEAALRSGRLTSLTSGAYVESDLLLQADAIGKHRMHLRGQLLVLPPGWYAARRSAALVHALPLIGKPPLQPQLIRSRVSRAMSHNRHRRQGLLDPQDLCQLDGLPVVSMARTVVDIARDECLRNAVVVADAALRAGLERSDLTQRLDRMRRWPGVVAARTAVWFASALAESPLESVSRVAMHELGLPAPELQVEVWADGEFVARVDHLWREFRTVGEADGLGKYGTEEKAVTTALRREKRTMDRLEDLGFEVVRWGWADAWRPEGTLRPRLLRSFERGRRQELDPSVRFVTTSPGVRWGLTA